MGLLDDNDVPKFVKSGRGEPKWKRRDNFAELQNLGHERQSDDFSSSPFADRRDKPLRDE